MDLVAKYLARVQAQPQDLEAQIKLLALTYGRDGMTLRLYNKGLQRKILIQMATEGRWQPITILLDGKMLSAMGYRVEPVTRSRNGKFVRVFRACNLLNDGGGFCQHEHQKRRKAFRCCSRNAIAHIKQLVLAKKVEQVTQLCQYL